MVTLPKNCWIKVLGSVVIQLYASECTASVDRALSVLTFDRQRWALVNFNQIFERKNVSMNYYLPCTNTFPCLFHYDL